VPLCKSAKSNPHTISGQHDVLRSDGILSYGAQFARG
jgi:hypothetical protein